MRIDVRYFAILRERTGTDREALELADGGTVGALFDQICELHAEVAPLRKHLRAAVNQEFVTFDAALKDGDEVVFIPPVSGGGGPPRFAMTDAPLDPNVVAGLVRRPEAGAVVTFEGVVRNHTDDRDVVHLEYEAYVEMALVKLREVATDAETQWPSTFAAIHHRYGHLEIGEAAVVIAVSSPHRAEAFAAASWIIDRLKEVVPIWKKEVGPDGSSWVGVGP